MVFCNILMSNGSVTHRICWSNFSGAKLNSTEQSLKTLGESLPVGQSRAFTFTNDSGLSLILELRNYEADNSNAIDVTKLI